MKDSKSNIFAGLGIICYLLSNNYKSIGLPDIAGAGFLLGVVILFFIATALKIRSKGNSKLWYIIGIVPLFGFAIAAWLLPNRNKIVPNG